MKYECEEVSFNARQYITHPQVNKVGRFRLQSLLVVGGIPNSRCTGFGRAWVEAEVLETTDPSKAR